MGGRRRRKRVGAILTGLGRYEEAEPCLVEAHARLEEIRSGRSFRTRKALRRLLDLYSAWGRPEELDRYRAMAEPLDEPAPRRGEEG
ncbi:MAG: tetratricopeptide repeat protein [bacterium]|nr:tetratricopeptide repeat protein [bacterium]